jgi:transposase
VQNQLSRLSSDGIKLQTMSEEKHLNVVLSNPIKTRAIASAKIKTDKLDAAKLANLLRGGYIAECYVPDRKIMDLRELVRHRAALVRMRTKLKNKIHSIVLMKGIQISSKHSSFTHLYNEELKALNDYRINGYLHLIESLDSEIKDVSKKIMTLAKEDEMASLLMTIPGIGPSVFFHSILQTTISTSVIMSKRRFCISFSFSGFVGS